MSAVASPPLPPVGSRWYIAGQHWEVEEHTMKEGEPAVRVRCVTGVGRTRFVWIWRLASRRAIESAS